MKSFMLVLVMVVIAGNVWADCRVLEYAEIKDMTDAELQKEVKHNDSQLRNMNKRIEIQLQLSALGDRTNTDAMFKDATKCSEQYTMG
jgi:hypothetical protein